MENMQVRPHTCSIQPCPDTAPKDMMMVFLEIAHLFLISMMSSRMKVKAEMIPDRVEAIQRRLHWALPCCRPSVMSLWCCQMCTGAVKCGVRLCSHTSPVTVSSGRLLW
jgi:hypothetical protein